MHEGTKLWLYEGLRAPEGPPLLTGASSLSQNFTASDVCASTASAQSQRNGGSSMALQSIHAHHAAPNTYRSSSGKPSTVAVISVDDQTNKPVHDGRTSKPLHSIGGETTTETSEAEQDHALEDEDLWGEVEAVSSQARMQASEASAGVLPSKNAGFSANLANLKERVAYFTKLWQRGFKINIFWL